MSARDEGVGGKMSLYAPRRSSQHLAGDTFQFDGEQLNPGTAGQREVERKETEGEKKKMRRSERSNQSTSPGFR